MKVLITGSAGFIGFHLVDLLLNDSNVNILGLDIINDYYDINLKHARLEKHGICAETLDNRLIQVSSKFPNYRFLKADLSDYDFLVDFMIKEKFDYVINLAAQAGVRYSIDNPKIYISSNVDGFLSILEGCRHSNVKHLIYASTSSVYGLNSQMPLNEKQPTEHPISLYSATKKANEMMAHTYSHLYGIPTTGVRFFTVYGPWGRPDMALFLFAKAILNNQAISVYNHGKMIRDFTFVSDIVSAISRLISIPPNHSEFWDSNSAESDSSSAPYRILNIGNGTPVELNTYIEAIEKKLGRFAQKNYMEMQPGDVPKTHADISSLVALIGDSYRTNVEDGVSQFIDWYLKFYKISL